MSVSTLDKVPHSTPTEIVPSETEEERRIRHAKILEKYDKNPELKGQVCEKIFDIADHYVDILKDSDCGAEHEGFIEHMKLTADIVDKFASDKIPVTAVYAAIMHDFAQRLASPYQEVRDAATLALVEFYELPEELVAKEEKDYVAEILRDLNDLGSQAYRHRKSLNKEKYEKNAINEGLDSDYIGFGYVVLTNGVKVTKDLPPELWSIDIPLVDVEILKDEIHATNIEANVIIAAEALAHIAVVDPEDQAKQYRAYVEFMAMHGPVLELLTLDALGGIAGRSTALRVKHEKLGHNDALDKAREILQDVSEFGGIDGLTQLLYSVGNNNIVKVETIYPDTEVVKNAELKVCDNEAIDIAQYMDIIVTYKIKNELGEDVEVTKRIVIRRKGLGSIADKMESGSDYSIDNPPADVLAATEIVGYVAQRADEGKLTQEQIKELDKKDENQDEYDQQQLALNFVEELKYIADLQAKGKLVLKSTVKNDKIRQPIFVQGGKTFKKRIKDTFDEYEKVNGEAHPLANSVEYKEKDMPFEVAKFMCDFIVIGDDNENKKVSFEKQFVTDLMRKKSRTDDKVAHVAYKAGQDQTVPEGAYEEIRERISRLSKNSLEVNTNLRPDRREKITGEQFWTELRDRRLPQDTWAKYDAIVSGERNRRIGNTVLANLRPEDYGISV